MSAAAAEDGRGRSRKPKPLGKPAAAVLEAVVEKETKVAEAAEAKPKSRLADLKELEEAALIMENAEKVQNR